MLDLFTEARPQWSPEELMKELGYTRPTLYRYLKSLKDSGFVMPTRGGRFALGPRVVEMDYLSRRSDPLIAAATPHLERLSAAHPCTALVVRWYGEKMLCVASIASVVNPVSSYPRGRPMAMGRGAIARSIMAFLPKQRVMPLVARYAADLRSVGVGDTSDEILAALKRVRRGCLWRSDTGRGRDRRADPRCGLPDRKPLHHDRRTTCQGRVDRSHQRGGPRSGPADLRDRDRRHHIIISLCEILLDEIHATSHEDERSRLAR